MAKKHASTKAPERLFIPLTPPCQLGDPMIDLSELDDDEMDNGLYNYIGVYKLESLNHLECKRVLVRVEEDGSV